MPIVDKVQNLRIETRRLVSRVGGRLDARVRAENRAFERLRRKYYDRFLADAARACGAELEPIGGVQRLEIGLQGGSGFRGPRTAVLS